MKIGRFSYAGETFYGVIEEDNVNRIKSFDPLELSNIIYDLKDLKMLAPSEPKKVICVGLNYKDHAEELKLELPKSPVLFLKPPTSVIGPFDEIIYPSHMSKRVDYEAELVIVIGRKGKMIPKEKVKDYILGYTCGNDVTARDLQPKDGQWTIAKSFDTFAPIGPIITDEIDPNNVEIRAILNNKVVQKSNTRNFIFKVEDLVSFISHIMTLEPFDIIMTGTPSGIGPMNIGDKIEIEIEGIGKLVNFVR